MTLPRLWPTPTPPTHLHVSSLAKVPGRDSPASNGIRRGLSRRGLRALRQLPGGHPPSRPRGGVDPQEVWQSLLKEKLDSLTGTVRALSETVTQLLGTIAQGCDDSDVAHLRDVRGRSMAAIEGRASGTAPLASTEDFVAHHVVLRANPGPHRRSGSPRPTPTERGSVEAHPYWGQLSGSTAVEHCRPTARSASPSCPCK